MRPPSYLIFLGKMVTGRRPPSRLGCTFLRNSSESNRITGSSGPMDRNMPKRTRGGKKERKGIVRYHSYASKCTCSYVIYIITYVPLLLFLIAHLLFSIARQLSFCGIVWPVVCMHCARLPAGTINHESKNKPKRHELALAKSPPPSVKRVF